MSTPDAKIAAARGCGLDGRGRWFRYRNDQLAELHNALVENKEEFVAAIQADTGKSEFEATLEVSLVLRHLRAAYGETDFERLTAHEKSLRSEGRAEGPVGTVVVVGHWTAPLDSTFSPLAAAIVGGNAAVTILPPKATALYEAISRFIPPAVDREAYPFLLGTTSTIERALAGSPFDAYYVTSTDTKLRASVASVAGQGGRPLHLLPKRVDRHNIAIISKKLAPQDVTNAAREVVRGSFGNLAGNGLAAVSLVLVHEARHDDLVQELVAATRSQFPRLAERWRDLAQPPQGLIDAEVFVNAVSETSTTSTEFGRIALGGSSDTKHGALEPTIVERVPAASPLLMKRIGGPLLCVVPYTSTEAALLVAKHNLGDALYLFGPDDENRYLAQDLQPTMLALNTIPLDVIGGMPQTLSSSGVRVGASLFTRTTCVTDAHTKSATDGIFAPYATFSFGALDKQLMPGPKKLRIVRKPHSNSIRRVFFLQGLFFSLSAVLGTVVTLLALVCMRG